MFDSVGWQRFQCDGGAYQRLHEILHAIGWNALLVLDLHLIIVSLITVIIEFLVIITVVLKSPHMEQNVVAQAVLKSYFWYFKVLVEELLRVKSYHKKVLVGFKSDSADFNRYFWESLK